MRPEPAADFREGRVGIGVGQAADEMGAGERHGGPPLNMDAAMVQ